MSKAKHAPAPWRVEVPSDSNGYVNIETGGNSLIGYYGEICEEPGNPTDVAMATARLIAEAPAMLEMLQEIADKFDKDQHLLNVSPTKIKELIKKIEG